MAKIAKTTTRKTTTVKVKPKQPPRPSGAKSNGKNICPTCKRPL